MEKTLEIPSRIYLYFYVAGPFMNTIGPEDSKCSNAHPQLCILFLDYRRETWLHLLAADAIMLAHVLF